MENKVLKRILVMAIVFVITFSNCGLTLQALATSDGISIFGFSLFGKNTMDYKAYFLDENGKEKDEMTADINSEMTLVLELKPKKIGYLKSATIKAVTDEGEPNFEFKEILNLSSNEKKEESLEQKVQLQESLLKTAQSTLTELPEMEIPEPPVTNTVSEENDVTNTTVEVEPVSTDITEPVNQTKEENVVAEETAIPSLPEVEIPEPVITEKPEEDVLVDEEVVYQEEAKEMEENTVIPVSPISAKINNEDEIVVENVAEETKIFVKLAYKPGETLKVADLYKEISLEMQGTYIDENLEEIEISATDKVTVEWTYSKDIQVSSEISKVSPFEVEGTKGTLVESRVTVNRTCDEENYLPLKETVLEIEVPKIKDKLPIALDVRAEKLKATIGEDINEITFNSNNWKYDENSNTITIKVENPDAVLTNGEDIYVIVYRYNEYVESEEITVNTKGTVTVEEYSGKTNKKITKDFENNKKTVVNIGELITYSIGTTEDVIGKGKINANYNSVEAVYETEFTSTVSINILTNDVLKEFTLKDIKEYYVDKTNLEFEAHDVKYKTIKFKYNEIIDVLKQGGKIEIRSNTGEVLKELNHMNVLSEESCEVNLNGDVHSVEISVKNVKVNGTITVDFIKSIGKCAYEKATFNTFDKIESRIKAEVKYGTSDEVIELTPLKTEKYFEKSYTKAEITMDTKQLSTIADNENVELKIELFNHDENSDLYINPEFEVVFPSYVQNVEVKSVNLLYEEGLTVKNVSLFKDNNGIQRMKISLEGVQRNFSASEITNGTNIIINTKIVVDDYTPKKDDQLKMYYFNQGVTNYQSQTDWKISSNIPDGMIKNTNGFDLEVFTFQAPSGFITANGIENYDGFGSTIDTVKQGEITAKAEMGETARPVTMKLAALNNTGNVCTGVSLLGRIPHKDATDVVTGEKLGTNTNTQLISEIIQDPVNPIGCDIYYSYNPKADISLTTESNGWTKNPEDMSEVKSFLIVPTSKVEPGTLFKFTYNFQVPANLPYEVEMYGSFGAFYNNHTDLAVVYESTKADLVGLVTDAGPRLNASLSVDIGDGAKVLSARRMKYILTVVNSGSITATNVKASIPVPKYTTYTSKSETCSAGDYGFMNVPGNFTPEFDIGTLEPGQTKTVEITVKTANKPYLAQYADDKDDHGYYMIKNDGTKEYITEVPAFYIKNKATVTTDVLANPIESNEVKNELEYANFDTYITLDYDREMIEGYETNFTLRINNIAKKDLKKVVAVFNVGNVYNYVSGSINREPGDITFNAEEGKIYFKIPEIKEDEETVLRCNVKTNNINKGKEEYNCRFEIMADGMTSPEYSTTVYQCIKKGILEAKDNTINPKTSIKEGETIIVSTEIKNVGEYISTDASFECEVPNNMEVVSVKASNYGEISTGNGTGQIKDTIQSLKPQETMTIDMTLKAKNMSGTDPIQVMLNRVVKQKNLEDIKIEPFKFTVLNTEKTEEEIIQEEHEKFIEAENRYKEEHKNDKKPEVTPEPTPTTPEEPKQEEIPEEVKPVVNPPAEEPKQEEPKEEKPIETTPEPIPTYYIKGVAWLDANKNGAREDDEKGLSSVKVYLLTPGYTMLKSTTTNSYGIYQFDNVENGKYVVAFAYDNTLYTTTIYKKGDVEEDRNSDVIESNSEDMNAISNTITVENNNVDHIDIGLQKRDTFDLQITKALRKATVTTKKGTKEYKYKDVELAKIDINSKQIKGAKVELEYVITLENKGSLPGYAEQVIDYIGSDIEFDESINQDWYKGNDGYIYMKNVNQNTLNPGQKKEYAVKLVKTMTAENTGTLSNKVEILKALTNSAEQERIDNNSSVQNTIITVSTGRAAQNTILIIFIVAILAGLGYKGILPIDIHFNKVYKAKDKKFSLKKFYK